LANESEGNCQLGWTISHGGVGVRGKEGFWYCEGVREGRIDMNGPWTFDFDLFLDFDFDLWARKMDSLDSLPRSALACDVEYDQIPEVDNFGIATRGEEIDLTLFSLTSGPYQMSYPYEGASSPPYTKEKWNGLHVPKDNILCKDIFKDPNVYRKALD
nr:hypothetical protein [Tanacetum cinerariifolium]